MTQLATPILLTGATGFIGARLARQLVAQGADVAALVLPGERAQLPTGVHPYLGDVTDSVCVSRIVNTVQPGLIMHLAAVGITRPNLPFSEALRVNVGGMVNVLEAARERDCVQRIVAVGSSYEYGARRAEEGIDPFNAYSASKVAAWACARAAHNAWGAPVVWVRPFQVYGPGQRETALIPAAIHAALTGADFPMTAGEQQRDFIYVDDVVAGLLAAATTLNIEGQALDLGTDTLHRICDVVAKIWQLTDAHGKMQPGALAYRPGEVPTIPADAARARRLTGWAARVSLEAGLSQTIAALREQYVLEAYNVQ